MTIIKDNSELINFCNEIKHKNIIAIDTEFTREKTYYPKLCLLQITDGEIIAAIDTLSVSDLSPLFAIILDDNITKIIHSAKQDLEIILNLTGKIPQNIFDTQLVASVCGFGESVAYSDLVQSLIGASVDKSQRYTNWENRPLSQKQIDYALTDVEYLIPIYNLLKEKLTSLNRAQWLEEGYQKLLSVNNYYPNLENLWTKIKFRTKSKKFTYLVKELAKWRELKAQNLNLTRNFILSDKSILDITSTSYEISNPDDLNLPYKYSSEIKTVIENFIAENNYEVTFPKPEFELNDEQQSLFLMLKLVLKLIAVEQKVPEKIIADSKMIEQFICLHDSAILQGWRYQIFGQIAQKVTNGELSIRYNQGKIEIN
jgi:ribonuclease D